MREHATALADAIEGALPGWVERSVAQRLHGQPELDGPTIERVLAAAAEAGRRARAEVGPRVRALLEADIDEQPTTPLALVRTAVSYPGTVLAAAGVPPARRDDTQVRLFPDDVYDLTPASFADVGPELAEPGLAWGVAKAWCHRRRHGTGTPLRGPLGPGTPLRGPLGPGTPLRGPLGPGTPLRGPLGPGTP
ncbi:MAG: hypothetical protein ACR2LJ_10680, partial [Acidimicrobiales bacterium]